MLVTLTLTKAVPPGRKVFFVLPDASVKTNEVATRSTGLAMAGVGVGVGGGG